MKLITGGVYQGKLEYALKTYSFTEKDVFTCSNTDIDYSKPVIYGLERFTYELVRQNGGVEPLDYFRARKGEWENSILIAADISCGVVPIDAVEREWREAHGRLLNYLSAEADTVIRMFMGIAEILKGDI